MFHNNFSPRANKGAHPTHQPNETNSIQLDALIWFFWVLVAWNIILSFGFRLILPNSTHHIYVITLILVFFLSLIYFGILRIRHDEFEDLE